MIVEILLKYKAEPNVKEYFDIGQKAPIHYAVQKNNYEVVAKLLEYGANPSIQDKKGFTALHYAARFGFKEIVNLLIANGADINLRD